MTRLNSRFKHIDKARTLQFAGIGSNVHALQQITIWSLQWSFHFMDIHSITTLFGIWRWCSNPQLWALIQHAERHVGACRGRFWVHDQLL